MRGEADPTARRTDEFKRQIGRAIETALVNAGIEKKAAAYTMGYGDNHASLSNWIRGEETPQFAKLWELGDVFRRELVIALAGLTTDAEIQTSIRFPKRKAVNL